MPEINQAWLALFAALLGGSGLKVIEYWLNRSKTQDDSAAAMRTELREEVRNLREELRTVEEQLDLWRGKYYELMEEFMKAKGDLAEAMRHVNRNQLKPDSENS